MFLTHIYQSDTAIWSIEIIIKTESEVGNLSSMIVMTAHSFGALLSALDTLWGLDIVWLAENVT